MVRLAACDVRALRVALRLVNRERDRNAPAPVDAFGAPIPGGWDAVAINLDRIAEDASDALDHESGSEARW